MSWERACSHRLCQTPARGERCLPGGLDTKTLSANERTSNELSLRSSSASSAVLASKMSSRLSVIAFINSSTFTLFYANQIIFLILGIIESDVVLLLQLVYSRHSGVMSIVYKMHKTPAGTAATATIMLHYFDKRLFCTVSQCRVTMISLSTPCVRSPCKFSTGRRWRTQRTRRPAEWRPGWQPTQRGRRSPARRCRRRTSTRPECRSGRTRRCWPCRS